MTPAELDIVMNGAFIYSRADGSSFASLNYRLRDMGVPLVRRAGPLSADDLVRPASEYLARLNAALGSESA